MSTRAELIAREKTEEQIAEAIGADAMIYQTVEGLREAIKSSGSDLHYCAACFDGKYPTPDVTASTLSCIEAHRLGEQKRIAESHTADAHG